MEPEFKSTLNVFPDITVYCVDDERWYWDDNDTDEGLRGPFTSFAAAWANAGAWLEAPL